MTTNLALSSDTVCGSKLPHSRAPSSASFVLGLSRRVRKLKQFTQDLRWHHCPMIRAVVRESRRHRRIELVLILETASYFEMTLDVVPHKLQPVAHSFNQSVS